MTRRRARAVITFRVDRTLTYAALPIDDVGETMRRKEISDIVGHSFANGPYLDAVRMSRRRKAAHYRRSGQAEFQRSHLPLQK